VVYVDIPFPERIAFGAMRRVSWSTYLAQSVSGHENAIQNWSRNRHSFDVGFAVRTAADFAEVQEHFIKVRGRAKSFPMKDFLDFEVAASVGVLIEDEDVPGEYQLAKVYGAGADEYQRVITRPRAGTVTVLRTRAGNTVDITSDTTIDYDTGVVIPDVGIVLETDLLAWSGEFWVPSRYDTDDLPAVVINKSGDDLLVQCDGISIVEVRDTPIVVDPVSS